ncbi:glycogen-binding domain-containing protein [Aquimarina aggregata]|uniref:glycogen-binding domain-containing protein n=1 Tax=Aquimarina aggregata TaxID=1642818 RepID=UPI00249328D7|nr:glycogen-binding domain-containing protein [Aquimarina aggregata]
MKKNILHSILLILVCTSELLYAQKDPFKGYKIEGDMLVFVFDKRDYEKATGASQKIKIENLDIKNVVVAGEFNGWSKDKWEMIKIDANRYELRKKLSDFTDEFSWEFKFVINNAYWAEPSRKDKNITRAFENGYALPAYNLKMYIAYPDKNGNATFTLNGFNNAREVILSGSFNKWDEDMFSMIKNEECWILTLNIRPGTYQYKFIVDGKWMEDPENPKKVINEFNGYNSVLDIQGSSNFLLNGFQNAKKVILSGSFNEWSENICEMNKTEEGWKQTLMLSAGKYHYKFIVDDKWILDPDNPVREYDYNGNINSVCIVK